MSHVLCLWSGPRNISTAMMRSFGARADVTCWDEPFFAPFLHKTGLDHPGRAETLEACETDAHRVATRITQPVPTAYHFQKHMAHHMLPDFPMDWAAEARHVLLIRHPARVIASYVKGRPNFHVDDLGFRALRDVQTQLSDLTGQPPLVVESDAILRDPASTLTLICEEGFDVDFDPAMLRWDPGPRPEDGPWAPYWYDNVIRSSHFGPPSGVSPDVQREHTEIYKQCLSDYEALKANAADLFTL